MNGRYLLDTNIIIYAINNKIELPSANYAISVITKMELLSFPKITPIETESMRKLLSNFKILEIDSSVKNKTIEFRKNYSIKLPDSIICATAYSNNMVLVTNDKQLQKVEEIEIKSINGFLNENGE